MTAHGEIHVTLKTCIPYDKWEIVLQATKGKVRLKQFLFPFNVALYPGITITTTTTATTTTTTTTTTTLLRTKALMKVK